MLVRPHLCAITDCGKLRRENQDDFYLSSNDALWIVADGMGGQAAGDLASATTINAIVDGMSPRRAEADPAAWLTAALQLAQERVRRLAAAQREYRGMRSAVAAAYQHDGVLHVCHAGDVRCYILAADGLHRLTDDHSLAASMVRAQLLADGDARSHPGRNVLEQAVGTAGRFDPAITSRRLTDGDRVLLCSDGVWSALDDDTIAELLGSPRPIERAAAELVDQANAADGSDNLTVVAYEHTAG